MRNTAAQHQLHVAAIGMNQVQAGVALNVVGNPFSILRERGFKEFI